MNTSKIYIAIFLLLTFGMGCRKENITTEIETNIPDPTVFIESAVYGLITDENGMAIENATISWGTSYTESDKNGYFKITSTVAEKASLLKVSKSNYFEAHQVLSPIKGSKIRTSVKLIERTLSGSISANSGGIINVNGGGTVDFAGNSFTDASGEPYTGQVNVYTTYLDPSRPDLRAVMPGNLSALDANDQMQLLKSFGMINVELEGSAGEKLQISQPATLTAPIPSTLLATAPSTIPLWHFNEENGLWIQEGQATLNGNEYTGEVAHFSWWNYDVPQDFIFLEGDIDTEGGYALVNIRITNLVDGSIGTLTSSESGEFAGFVPKEVDLLLELLNDCDEVIYSEEIGSFSVDTELASIFVEIGTFQLITITGVAQNCDLNPITNGYVMIQGIPESISTIINIGANGNFTGSIANCGAQDVSVTVVDLDALTQNIPSVFTIQQDIYLGVLSGCDQEIAERFTISKNNGEIESFTPCISVISNSSGYLTYEFQFSIPTPNSIIEYYFYFEWHEDNSEYITLSEWTEIGTYDWHYSLEGSYDEIIQVSENEMPGDIAHFIVTGFELRKKIGTTTVETFEGVTLDIKGTVQ